jgi:hypothetical protein
MGFFLIPCTLRKGDAAAKEMMLSALPLTAYSDAFRGGVNVFRRHLLLVRDAVVDGSEPSEAEEEYDELEDNRDYRRG